MKRSTILHILLTGVLIALSSAAYGQASVAADGLAASFSRHELMRASVSDNGNGSRQIKFSGDRAITVELTPHDLRSAGSRTENTGTDGLRPMVPGASTTFKGTVRGSAGSFARINFSGGFADGFINVGGETLFIEPAARYAAGADAREYILYRIEDAIGRSPFSCGSKLGDKINGTLPLVQGGESPAGRKRIELATDADMEYVATLGGPIQANNEILGILNTIEGLYANELNLTISVVYQHTWTAADPYAAANTEFTVRNFQSYWNAQFPHAAYPRDAAHLFSGKSNVQSQGWAFIGVTCRRPNEAYGMSGYVNWAPAKFLITAHELGHNLGANHVETAQSCGNSLMNAQLTGDTPMSFCQYSRAEIDTYLGTNGSCITESGKCAFDFEGDGKTDMSIFRPAGGEWWYLRSSDGGNSASRFGTGSDILSPADLTGDGKTDIAFFRPSTGFWYVLRSEDQSFYAAPFGTAGDVPVPADYDGDQKADIAVFRSSSQTWFIQRSSGGTDIVGFGGSADRPAVGDYDGDGKADIAVFRDNAGTGEWWIRRSSDNGVFAARFGAGSDVTVPGDYTGDGKADIALWRPSTGTWFILRSEDQTFYAFPFGSSEDLPVVGDYDGDGKTDAAVFRPSNSTWYAARSSAGTLIQQFGQIGDVPIAHAFVR
ncbi:MAG: FG-GAP-like repeat-containing protein [Pyrinomonadaceae bacterium]|nr:FG-GAP-like repeat-containing protein [Pyrinomonadaceae bacterium]